MVRVATRDHHGEEKGEQYASNHLNIVWGSGEQGGTIWTNASAKIHITK